MPTKAVKAPKTESQVKAKKPDSTEETVYSNNEALRFHRIGKPGKIAIAPTKPLLTQRDLSLAYSPGVAAPCLEIAKDPAAAFEYTAKGNMVAVISNGTAVLGLGNLGALASKPVMEGKSVLFKRFADIDSIDVEVDVEDPDAFINAVRYLGPSWGGINLEDIKAPECFIIESKLKELMDIPVFHDDQHGTAIVTAAALINAAHLTGRKLSDMKMVVLGAGSAGIACLDLAKALGVKNALLIDREGVIYKGRTSGMNQWKTAHAADTTDRTLEDAMRNADVFYGLAGKDSVSKEMVATMAKNPIIFAMANPDPEIRPEDVRAVRDDAIIATGRSDYNNQVNNVLGFPYIFRGALDVHATEINEEMKVAAAKALAELARQPVPQEVATAYGVHKQFGPDYIIPSAFDPRLISTIPVAVAKAAMETGVARKPIKDMNEYARQLAARLNPTANLLSEIQNRLREQPRRVVFAEGEEEVIVRAAFQWREQGFGEAVLVGREKRINEIIERLGIVDRTGVTIQNAAIAEDKNDKYVELMYKRTQRRGMLLRDCNREVKNDRVIYASCMVAAGDADIMITGLTRSYSASLKDILQIIPAKDARRVFGMTMVVSRNGQTIFVADSSADPYPPAEALAENAINAANFVRKMGFEPRVALLSFSNFGNPMHERAAKMREAITILDNKKVDFEYDGEMTADVALNESLLKLYPFCRLTKPANILIMPGLHTANISTKLVQEMGGGTIVGPVLVGLSKSVQIIPMNSGVADIINLTALASVDQ